MIDQYDYDYESDMEYEYDEKCYMDYLNDMEAQKNLLFTEDEENEERHQSYGNCWGGDDDEYPESESESESEYDYDWDREDDY